jgi:1-acyl-sn-glycerol-3-phosphate acyltransferase
MSLLSFLRTAQPFTALRFYGSLAVTGLIFVGLDAGSFLLRRFYPEGVARRQAGQRWLHALSRLAVRYLHAAGILDCDMSALVPLQQTVPQPLVLVANHPSRLDSLLLASALPGMTCVTKASIWDRGVLGSTLRTAGYIRHDTLLRVLGPATERLREGGPLLLFPEGTRARAGAAPGPMRPGFAAIAQRTRLPVQVILIETDSPYLSQGWPFLKRPPLPMRYRIRLGPRLPAPTDEASGRTLLAHVEAQLTQTGMQPPTAPAGTAPQGQSPQ